jgi:hypothetical protein
MDTVHSIDLWVKGLELICIVYAADDVRDHVEYL